MAAKTANLYARIEPDVKEQAEADLRSIFEYIALSGFRIFVKNVSLLSISFPVYFYMAILSLQIR